MAHIAGIKIQLPNLVKNGIYSYFKHQISRRPPYKYIFLFSHMRSGSSLLTHLLCNSPEILGYGETHIQYNHPSKLLETVCKSRLNLRRFFRTGTEKFVFDKILHNRLFEKQSLELIKKVDCHAIFLLRNYGPTMNSITQNLKFPDKDAYTYYTTRLLALQEICHQITKTVPSFFLNYEDIIHNTEETLSALCSFLNLEGTLKSQYKLFPSTGKKGIGDFQNNIYSGAVQKNTSFKGFTFPDKKKHDYMVALYHETKKSLSSKCDLPSPYAPHSTCG